MAIIYTKWVLYDQKPYELVTKIFPNLPGFEILGSKVYLEKKRLIMIKRGIGMIRNWMLHIKHHSECINSMDT
ncbi:hypothetical protein HI914_05821 [Erysiphe necator]|nr:hypothetical protein HI914_05821 [Erysiphe necator]